MKKWFILLLLLIFLFGCKSEQKNGVTIENITISELAGGNHSISYDIKNFDSFPIDCYAKIFLGNRTVIRDIGIIGPENEEKKQTILNLKNGKTEIKINPICKKINDSAIQKCNNLKTYTDRRICELEIEYPELNQCSGKKPRQSEIFCIALTLNNPQICGYILTPKKYWCAAYISGNYSLCEKMTDSEEKDWCYMDIGMNKKNKDLCEKINNESKKTSCMGVVFLDADMCLEGDEKSKQACIMNIVESTGDKTLCEKLDDNLKKECYSVLEG